MHSKNMSIEILGQRFKDLRKNLKITQEDLGKKLDIHQNTISRFENGGGINMEVFINILNFFSQHFLLNNIFCMDFMIIPFSKDHNKLNASKQKAVEEIKKMHKELTEKTDHLMSYFL